MPTDILSRLQPIFHDVLDDPKLVITRESSARNTAGWDSLVHVNLIMAVEDEFKIKFALGELEEVKNVGDMIDLMERKIAKR